MTSQSDYELALDLIGAAIGERAARLDEMRGQGLDADLGRLITEIDSLRARQRQLDPNDPEMIRNTLAEYSSTARVAGGSGRAVAAAALHSALDADWLAEARRDAVAFDPPTDTQADPGRLFLAALIDAELAEQEISDGSSRMGGSETSLEALLESDTLREARGAAADGVAQIDRADLQAFFENLDEFLAEAAQLGATVSEHLRPAERKLVPMGDADVADANYEIDLLLRETALGLGAVLRAVLDGGTLFLTLRYLDALAEDAGIVAGLATAGGATIAVRMAPVAGERSMAAAVAWRDAALPNRIVLTLLAQ